MGRWWQLLEIPNKFLLAIKKNIYTHWRYPWRNSVIYWTLSFFSVSFQNRPLNLQPYKFLQVFILINCLMYRLQVVNCVIYRLQVANCLTYRLQVANCLTYRLQVVNCLTYRLQVANCLMYRIQVVYCLMYRLQVVNCLMYRLQVVFRKESKNVF